MEKRSACLKTFLLSLILLASLVLSCFNVVSESQEFIPDNWYADPYFDRLGPITGAGIDTWEQRVDLQEPVRPDLLVQGPTEGPKIQWQESTQSKEAVRVLYAEDDKISPQTTLRNTEGNIPLGISSYGPRGKVSPEDEIFAVSFNQAMVPESELGEQRSNLPYARIEPEAPGYFVWYSPQSLSWIPTQPLEETTDYQFILSPGVPVGAGPSLASEWRFSFYLQPLRILAVEPLGGNIEGPLPMPEARSFRLLADRAIDPGYFKAWVKVLVNQEPWDYTLTGPDGPTENKGEKYEELLLRLKQDPPEQAQILIQFADGAKAHPEALAPLEATAFAFETLAPFRVIALESQSSDFPELRDQNIRYVFLNTSHKLLEDNALEEFQLMLGEKIVTPSEILQRGKSVFFHLPEGQAGDRLNLRVPPQFRDFYGRNVENILEYSMILEPGSLTHNLPSAGDFLWPRHWGTRIPLAYRNLRAVALSWFPLDDLYLGLPGEEKADSLNLEDQALNKRNTASLPPWPEEDSPGQGFWEVFWNARLGGEGTGYPLQWEAGRFRLQSTSIGVLAKVGFDRILVFAYDLETTEAISQGEVTIYTQEGPLFQGQTNSRGIAEFYLEPGVFSSSFSYGYDLPGGWMHLRVRTEDDQTQLRLGPPPTNSQEFPFPRVFPHEASQTRNRVYLFTDKTNYSYGQRMYFKGFHWEQDHQGYRPSRIEEANVELWRLPQNQQVASQRVKPSFSGSFHQYFRVGRELPQGVYELRYTSEAGILGRQRVGIGEVQPGQRALPEAKIKVDYGQYPVKPEKSSYQIGDLLRLRGSHGLLRGKHTLVIQQETILSYREFQSSGTEISIDLPLTKEHFPGVTLGLFSRYPRITDPDTGAVLQESFAIATEIPLVVDSPVLDLQVDILSSRTPFNPSESGYLGAKISSGGFPISAAEVTLMVVPEDRPPLLHPNSFFYQPGNFPFGVLGLNSQQKIYGGSPETPEELRPIPTHTSNSGNLGSQNPAGQTLFFFPNLRSNGEGIASVALDFPRDINGKWKIIALVNKEGRFGLGEKTLDLQPALSGQAFIPSFVNQRDRVSLPLELINYSDSEREVNISIDAAGFRFPHGETMKAVIPPNSGHRFIFTGEALEAGTFALTFRDFGNGGGVFASDTLTIHPALSLKTPFSPLNFQGQRVQTGIFLPEENFSGAGGLSLVLGLGPGLSLLPTLERMQRAPNPLLNSLRSWVALAVGEDSHRQFLQQAFPPMELTDIPLSTDTGRDQGRVLINPSTDPENLHLSSESPGGGGEGSHENTLTMVRDEPTLLMLHAHNFAGQRANQFRQLFDLRAALNYLFQKATNEIEDRDIGFVDLWGYYLLAKAQMISSRTLGRFADQVDSFGVAELSLLSRTYLVLGDFARARGLFQQAKDFLTTSEGRIRFKVSYQPDSQWRSPAGELGPFLSVARLLDEPRLFQDAVRDTLEDHLIKAEGQNIQEDFWSFVSLAEDIGPFPSRLPWPGISSA
jgi:hypothetical protein